MATKKVTVTIDEGALAAVRGIVAAGQASSVSAFVQHAVRIALDDAAAWDETLTRWLDDTGGPLTDDERIWADAWIDGRGPSGAA